MASPERLMGWMASLADPTRLRLLRLLERRELGVVELTDILQLPQSSVSRHLKLLSDEGFLRSRALGTTRLYQMEVGDAAARRLWLLAREQTQDWATIRQDQLRLAERLKARPRGALAFFASAAARWDKLRDELYGRGFVAAAVAALLPADWVVVDLGCGTGAVTADLAPHVRQVVGIDQSAAMLKAARKRTAHLLNVELKQAELAALPLPDAAADGALMVLALSYVEDPLPALREMRRVLRPGGRAVVVDVLRHDREDFRAQMGQVCAGFEPAAVGRLLREAGFTDDVCRPLSPESGVKGPALFMAKAGVPRGASERRRT